MVYPLRDSMIDVYPDPPVYSGQPDAQADCNRLAQSGPIVIAAAGNQQGQAVQLIVSATKSAFGFLRGIADVAWAHVAPPPPDLPSPPPQAMAVEKKALEEELFKLKRCAAHLPPFFVPCWQCGWHKKGEI